MSTQGNLAFLQAQIPPVAEPMRAAIEQMLNGKIKPLGSLGELEKLATQLCLVQRSLSPQVLRPTVLLFAADHGITAEGVSAFPSSITAAMVRSFLSGGAAINVFARLHEVELMVVDAGVAAKLPTHPLLVDAKVAMGTANFLHGPAMIGDQCSEALRHGAALVDQVIDGGANVVGCGEMGIGNTTAAAAIMSLICDLPVETCVGRGSGVDQRGLDHKLTVIKRALGLYSGSREPWAVLNYFGGFELAMICGATIRAAQRQVTVLVDGYCATAAILVAAALRPEILPYCVFSHESAEPGHALMLRHLGVTPLLRLGMRLGEGTGCAVALPLVRAACALVNEMATFESAGMTLGGLLS